MKILAVLVLIGISVFLGALVCQWYYGYTINNLAPGLVSNGSVVPQMPYSIALGIVGIYILSYTIGLVIGGIGKSVLGQD